MSAQSSLVLVPALAFALAACPTGQEKELQSVQPVPRSEEWWTERHAQKLAEVARRAGRVDLLMIGDSITQGWELEHGRAIWDEFYGERNAYNIGYSGDCTEHVLWRLANGEVQGIRPRLAVLMVGTNNVGHRHEPSERTAAGVRAILVELQRRLPETKVLLLGIFPRGVDGEDELRRLNDGTNEILATFADGERVFYLDLSDAFLDADGVLPEAIMPDRLHPNAKGYRLWAEAMEPTVAKLLGEED